MDLFSVMESISKELREEFFPRSRTWECKSARKDTYYIGDNGFYFWIEQNNQHLQVSLTTFMLTANQQKEAQHILVDVLRKSSFDLLVCFLNSPVTLFSTGPNSDFFLSVVQEFPFIEYTWYGSPMIQDKHQAHNFYFSLGEGKEIIVTDGALFSSHSYSRFSDVKVVRKIYSIEEADAFLEELTNYKKEMVEREKEFLTLIKTYDPAAYFQEKNSFYWHNRR